GRFQRARVDLRIPVPPPISKDCLPCTFGRWLALSNGHEPTGNALFAGRPKLHSNLSCARFWKWAQSFDQVEFAAVQVLEREIRPRDPNEKVRACSHCVKQVFPRAVSS